MDVAPLSARISSALALETPPVALAFVDEAPEGVPGPPREVPSSCSFWREAENGTFYASAKDHFNCPIGAYVMGFELPEDVGGQLGELITGMGQAGYLAADEPPAIPTMPSDHQGIVYGPLAESSGTPDVALLWLTPQQAMLANEAAGDANWTSAPRTTTGRPGCAALPRAFSDGHPTLSLGCAGMRTFTEVANDRMLFAVPGSALESFADALEQIGGANEQMLTFYRGQAAKFSTANSG